MGSSGLAERRDLHTVVVFQSALTLASSALMDNTTLYVLLVILVATFIRSVLGFGEALIAVPLLALRLPIDIAAPLAMLVSITVAAIILAQDWQHVELGTATWLLGATLFGIPLGLLLLTHGNERLVKAMLGALIAAFAAYSLAGRQLPELRSQNRAWLLASGFFAGILGGAYGMNGPPLVIYGAMRRWPAQRFRATLQSYFLPASVIGMIGYWLAGLWVHAVTRYYLLSLPVTLLAIFMGHLLTRRMHAHAFQRYVNVALLLIGAALLFQARRA
jgi:uncharacterized protein